MSKKEIDDLMGDGQLLQNPNDENDERTEGENIAEIINEWLNKKHVHAKTRLTKNQIVALTILKTLSDKYNIQCIKELIDNFVTYKLSEDGKSSKELVDILKHRTELEDDNSLENAMKPFLK